MTFLLAAEGGIATRAISDSTGADVLYYAIYNADKELITAISNSTNGLSFPVVSRVNNSLIRSLALV